MRTGARKGALCGAVGMLVFAVVTRAAETVVRCEADFSPLGQKQMVVEIAREADGRLQSQVNGKVSNAHVKLEEHRVRDNLNLRADPYGPEFRGYNPAEISLTHLQSLLDDKNLASGLRLSFTPAQVRSMKIYDLLGRTDKFGGTVLMEAYGRDGKLLGRVLRSLLANGCY